MSDLDFDKLITEGLAQGQAGPPFRDRLKQESGQAIVKGHQRRLWYRRTGVACVVLLVSVSAFWSGRITTKPQSQKVPGAIASPKQNEDTVLVARDLVTWLEAARFFRQLGMEERANRAFQLASALAPSMQSQHQMANQKTEARFVRGSQIEEKSLCFLLAQYDTFVEKQPKTMAKPFPPVKRKRLPIIAQSIGGENHGY
jgi:hypothetical protein